MMYCPVCKRPGGSERNEFLGRTLEPLLGSGEKSLLRRYLEWRKEPESKKAPPLWNKWAKKLVDLITPSDQNAEWDRAERWSGIGWEVFERKALLIAAAKDLEDNHIPNAWKLAATDIFVEKAQRLLTMRGRILYGCGVFTAFLAVVVLAVSAWFLFDADVLELLRVETSDESVSSAYLALLVLKSTTAGAFVVAIAYFLVSLSRATLHEATVLYNRRHSLRFGRLFVYLKSDELNREDLEKAFNWNAEFSSAFKDIQADKVMRSPAMKAVETFPEMIRATAELLKEAREAKNVRGDKPGKEV